MLQLIRFNDSMAGTEVVARHFPFRIGRAENSDLCLVQSGVWDEHVQLLILEGKPILTRCGEALVRVNGKSIAAQHPLRSGDLVQIGAAQFQIGLERAKQRGAALQTIVLFGLILGVTAIQAVLCLLLMGQ